MRRLILTLTTLALGAWPAAAWNSLGHKTVAEIAWRQMNAGERRAASDLLKHHPHYQLLLATNVPAGVDSNEWAFLNAAIWPDMVAPAKPGQPSKPATITQYNVYPHVIGLPFVRAGDAGRLSLKKFSVKEPNGQTGLVASLAKLKDPRAGAQDRALALCWVLHLTGDLHQPLHAATLVTKDKPHGNGAGSSFAVRDESGAPAKLHIFWDMLPGPETTYEAVAALASNLTAAPDLAPAKLNEYQSHQTVASWVQESFEAAVTFAYAEDRIQFASWAAFESGKIPAKAVPALRADYLREAHQMARRRLALAGQRLADELKQVW